MYLTTFEATNFRNIESCKIYFTQGVNLLSGENAQGKTNALEGIYYFARGKSFRGATDKDMIRFGENAYSLSVTYISENRKKKLSAAFGGGIRRRELNGIKIDRVADMLGHFRAVMFHPEHLQIVKEGPNLRREFLNVGISQLDPTYVGYYTEYNKVLENRNCLLKQAQKGGYFDPQELYAWSVKLAELSSHLNIKRKEYMCGILPHAKEILFDMTGKREEIDLLYLSDTEETDRVLAESEYKKKLTENSQREIGAGFTLWGIHRDDIEILLNGKSAKTFASQGQQRSLVLALKLAEGEYVREKTGEYPVYLFDDVLSELDNARRDYVLGLSGDRQLILSSCEEAKGDFNRIYVQGGRYDTPYR